MREGSAKALWNLSYISDNRAAVAEAGGVKLLVDMLRSDDKDKHAAARALWNLAYSEPNRQLISSAGGVRPLVALLKSDNVKEQEAATKALVNLTQNEAIRREVAEAGAIGSLGKLVNSRSSSQRAAAARALTNLAMHAENRAQMEAGGMVLPGLIKMVTPLPRSAAESAQKDTQAMNLAALRALRNIIADERPRQSAREAGLVPTVKALTDDEITDKETRELCLKILSELSADKKSCMGRFSVVTANGDASL
uniref:Vacuolar protein 8 n=1 Tax=Tetraselmis chuii TaxID=63592 RepID=A0A7S1T607_9CHLO